jgi:hypothetical protein
MHALTMAKGWGPSAPPGSPRSPLGGRAGSQQPAQPGGDVPGQAGARSATAVSLGLLAGPPAGCARRAGAGAPREGPGPARAHAAGGRAGAARGLPTALSPWVPEAKGL